MNIKDDKLFSYLIKKMDIKLWYMNNIYIRVLVCFVFLSVFFLVCQIII